MQPYTGEIRQFRDEHEALIHGFVPIYNPREEKKAARLRPKPYRDLSRNAKKRLRRERRKAR